MWYKQHIPLPQRPSIVIALLLFGVTAPATAQVLYGTLVGNVKDPKDAAVPNAEVTITSTENNQSRSARTNESGVYSIPTVSPGRYVLVVRQEGFQSYTASGVVVTINSVSRLDVRLQLGTVSESVTVSGAATVLQADTAEVRSELTSAQLLNMPLPPGRNFQYAYGTLPGFSPPADASSIPGNPSRALSVNVNGTTANSVNMRIDGVSSTNVFMNMASAYVPALESIETVNVVTNSFDAEQGIAGGAAVNVQIKSGSNQLHGSLFGFHNNNKMKAKPFFTPAGERNPKAVYNQLGATLGGPLKRDRLYYFASYEGTLNHQFAAKLQTVPTAAMRSGNMSASTTPVYDPSTGQPDGTGRTAFPGNLIPADRIDPIATKIMGLIPPASYDRLSNNYYAGQPFYFDRHTLDTKFNWNPTQKLSSYVRYSYLKFDSIAPPVFGDQLGGDAISGANVGHGFGATHSATFAATYVLRPTFIIDAYFGYTLMDNHSEQSRLEENVGLDFLGIPGTNGTRRFEGGWPRFQIDNFSVLGIKDAYMPYHRHDSQSQYVVNSNWTKGTHNIRFGMDLYRPRIDHLQPEFPGASHGASGGFTFSGGPTQLRGGASANAYNSYSTFLLGLPTTIGKTLQVDDRYQVLSAANSFFVRDQWQMRRKLTVSYGVRYEYWPFPTRTNRGLERYDFVNNKMLVCGVGKVPEDCGTKVSKKLFAPRVGIAYRMNELTVIRAGYGINYDPMNVGRNLRTNYPTLLVLNQTGATSFAPAGTLRAGIPPMIAPSLGNGVIDIPANYAVTSTGDEFQRGYVQSWNFTIQRQLRGGFTLQAGYVATRQVRNMVDLDMNVGRPGGGNASRPLFQTFGRQTTTALVTPFGTSKYDSLQTRLERRFSGGLQLTGSYTWSKSLGFCCTDNGGGSPRIQIPGYFNLNRALLSFDRPHNLQVTGMAELPFGRNKAFAQSGWQSALFGRWQMNGRFSAYSGSPFSVTASGTSLDAPGNTQRADQVKTEVTKIGGAGPGQSWFDPLAFAPVTAARFGTAGFNTLRGPGVLNLDAGLFREFKVGDRWTIQLRAEAVNVTNTPHFGLPGTNVSSLQRNADGSVRSLGGYTEISSVSGTGREGIDERVFRVGLRISF